MTDTTDNAEDVNDNFSYPFTYKGSCMCGAVSYGFDVDPPDYGFCHCKTCQKASGAAFTANIPIDRKHLHFSGEENIREFESSPGKLRCFCVNCGSPLYAYRRETPDMLRLRLGLFDTEFPRSPACHFFTEDMAAWFRHSHEAVQFERWPDTDFLVLHGSKQSDD